MATREPFSLALIVPTKDRPELLARLLASVARQSVRPAQVIVVDGGTVSVEPVVRACGLPARYLRALPPSLTRQKNQGIDALPPHAAFVGFLDDDLVLEDGALAAMAAFWAQADAAVGGAGLTNVLMKPRRGVWVKRLFALDGPDDGRVLCSGYNTSVRPQPDVYATQWLPGGASIWRREVVEQFRFDEWFTGYSYLEDVDYSLRVGRRYACMMIPEARMQHESQPMSRRQHVRFGAWQVTNRLYLVRKHPECSIGWCVWSLIGQLLLNATAGVASWGAGGVSRALGNLAGWARVIRHGIAPERSSVHAAASKPEPVALAADHSAGVSAIANGVKR